MTIDKHNQILAARADYLNELYDAIQATKWASNELKTAFNDNREPIDLKFYEDCYEQLHEAFHFIAPDKPQPPHQEWDAVIKKLTDRAELVIKNTSKKVD